MRLPFDRRRDELVNGRRDDAGDEGRGEQPAGVGEAHEFVGRSLLSEGFAHIIG